MVEVGGGCKRHHLERDGPELALVRRTNVVCMGMGMGMDLGRL